MSDIDKGAGTLGYHKRHGMGISAHCARPNLMCGHHKDLDLGMLIERFGEDYSVINETRIAKALRCEVCGFKGAELRIVANTSPGKWQNPYLKAKGV